jgi:PKD repeat protein
MKINILFVILFGFFLACGGIFAETTVTLRLEGTVGSVTSLSISTPSANLGIFTEDAVVDSLVATVTETNNSAKGYTVILNTKNGTTSGLLRESGGDYIPYLVKYNDIAVTFTAGTAIVTNRAYFSASKESKTVKVSYDIEDITNLKFGTYTDILTFVIATK